MGLIFCLSAQAQERELIKRSRFFTGVEYSGHATDEFFRWVVYRSSKDNSFYYRVIDDPVKQFEIRPKEKVTSWQVITNGLFFTSGAKLHWVKSSMLSAKQSVISDVKLPVEAEKVKLVRTPLWSTGKFLVSITAKNSEESGVYIYELLERKWKLLHEQQPFAKCWYDSKGKLVAASEPNGKGGTNILTYQGGKKGWKAVHGSTFSLDMFLGGFTKIISVSADGKTVYLTSNVDTDKSRLYALDVKKEKLTELASSDVADILPFGASVFSETGEPSSVVALYAETRRSILPEGAYAAAFKALEEKLEGDVSVANGGVHTGMNVLVREFTGGPSNIYMYNMKSRKLKFLCTDYPELENEKLASRKAHVVSVRDGMKFPVHVYLPTGSDKDKDGVPDQPLPTVLYVHGGPWVGIVQWNTYFFWRNYQLLANRGYVVIVAEFRGTTGLGKEVVNKSIKKFGSDMHNDLVDIVDWAIDKKIAHKDKVGIWGWSYGGYATMYAVGRAPDKFKCGLAMYGLSDLVSFGNLRSTSDGLWGEMVGQVTDPMDMKMLKEHSPLSYVKDIKVPLLLTTGTKDERVPQFQSDTMASAMNAAGKDITYFYYPEEKHDYREADSWISYWAHAELILSETLGGQYEDRSADFHRGNYKYVYGEEKRFKRLTNPAH